MASKKLFSEFPPVSTEEWTNLITKDLKGADFEKNWFGKPKKDLRSYRFIEEKI